MSSSRVLKVGNLTSTSDLNRTGKTDAQVGTILEWFIADWAGPMPEGLTAVQQNQWKLDQAGARVDEFIIATARNNRLKQLRAQQASIEAQADTDTAI